MNIQFGVLPKRDTKFGKFSIGLPQLPPIPSAQVISRYAQSPVRQLNPNILPGNAPQTPALVPTAPSAVIPTQAPAYLFQNVTQEPSEKTNKIDLALIGLLVAGVGALILSVILGGREKKRGSRPEMGSGEMERDDWGPEDWERFRVRPDPALFSGQFIYDPTAAEEEGQTPLFQQQFGLDPQRIAKYHRPPLEQPEITESDIYDALHCRGPHYNLRYRPGNWCSLAPAEGRISQKLRDDIIQYLIVKGYKYVE